MSVQQAQTKPGYPDVGGKGIISVCRGAPFFPPSHLFTNWCDYGRFVLGSSHHGASFGFG